MTDPERARMLDKVRKLLALAEGKGATPAEAATAAAQASAILERYKLDVAELQNVELEDDEPIERGEDIYQSRKIDAWLKILANVLGKHTGCHSYLFRPEGKRSWRLRYIGRKSDIEVATYLFAYLRREIDRLTTEALAEDVIVGRVEANNFRLGCLQTLKERLDVAKEEVREQATSNAIVRVDARNEAVEAFTKSMNLRAGRPTVATYDQRARNAGKVAGASIELGQGSALEGKRRELKA